MDSALLDALRPVQWPVFVLISARVGGMMLFAPVWSSGLIPPRLRSAIAVVLTLVLLPVVSGSGPTLAVPTLVVPLLTEALIGVAIGLTAATMVHALTVAAEVVSLQMGLSLGAAFGAVGDVGTPGIGQLYNQLFLVCWLVAGGALLVVQVLAESFRMIPPGGSVSLSLEGPALLTIGGTVLTTAVQVVAPVMVALLVTNLALAVVNRAIPQLNTMMVAVPVTIAVGLVALGAVLPHTAGLMTRWVGALDGRSLEMVRSLLPAGAP